MRRLDAEEWEAAKEKHAKKKKLRKSTKKSIVGHWFKLIVGQQLSSDLTKGKFEELSQRILNWLRQTLCSIALEQENVRRV